MNSSGHDSTPQTRRRSRARWFGLGAAACTAVAVSRATTPDGNLVVTMVPALVVGGLVYGVARWIERRGGRG